MKKRSPFLIFTALLCAIVCILSACSPSGDKGNTGTTGNTDPDENTNSPAENGTRIRFDFDGQTVYGTLDDNSASRDLISRLPLTLTFSDYSDTEKIAYLPDGSAAWDTSDAPDSCTPVAGDIAIYSPWGNLSVFYHPFRQSNGLIPLGKLDAGGAEKFAAIIEDFTVTISLANGISPMPEQTMPTESPNVPEQPSKTKILVAYFSCTGNTKAVAEKIVALTGGDLYEIVPAVPYSSADLNYNDNNCRANREMNDPSSRPAFESGNFDISAYDTVIIGYPIWWGTMPRILNTFLTPMTCQKKRFCRSVHQVEAVLNGRFRTFNLPPPAQPSQTDFVLPWQMTKTLKIGSAVAGR